MVDRATAVEVFDFIEHLRREKYRVGVDVDRDVSTARMLSALSGDVGLRDAVCLKLLSPGMERLPFLQIAVHDGSMLPVFMGQVKSMWDKSDYDVKRLVDSEFNQDVAALLWQLSVHLSGVDRRGVLEAASYLSYMQGDRGDVFAKYLGELSVASPQGEVTRVLKDAFDHNVEPASVAERVRMQAMRETNAHVTITPGAPAAHPVSPDQLMTGAGIRQEPEPAAGDDGWMQQQEPHRGFLSGLFGR